ncbi:platelet-derived growth factor receptor alpha-like [Copidosoma floridanum]|uniref:platelet-derived growth factor receptor alpha-like n=1 Tax=Copidosoma floridanum TaxID=29053 RepID=UPI000C6F987D|nr:platelet-derived growth factor receptor alpha-like [Copidosoma floridanum]
MAFSNGDANFFLTKAHDSNDSIEFRSASYCDDLQPSWRSNYEGNYQNWNAECICSHYLLSWAYQVAHGMEYLSRRNVLHCDLAARNILLSTNNIVKICDFGFAQTLYKDINYTRLHDVKLPYKRMAIESLRDGTANLGMQASVVYQKLIDGYRMGQPRYATKYFYNIMLNCWEDEQTLRPSFTKLLKTFGMLLDKSTRMHFGKLYQEYENINKEADLKRGNNYLINMSSPDKVALALPQQNYKNHLLLPNITQSVLREKSTNRCTNKQNQDDADEVITDKKHVRLTENSTVPLSKWKLELYKESYPKNPYKMVKALMIDLLGTERLKKMSPSGSNNREKIPTYIYDGVFEFATSNTKKDIV